MSKGEIFQKGTKTQTINVNQNVEPVQEQQQMERYNMPVNNLYRNLQVTDEEVHAMSKQELEARAEAINDIQIGRYLEQSAKKFGDSTLMKNVKKGIAFIDAEVNRKDAQNYTDNSFEVLFDQYFKTIDACRKYIESRDSKNKKGIERKILVQKNLDRLIREIELLPRTKELMRSGRLLTEDDTDRKDVTMKELLVRTRLYEFASAPAEKLSADKKATENITSPQILKILALAEPTEKKIKDKKKRAEYADDIGKLRRILKGMPEGKVHSEFVELQGVQVLICQDEMGTVTLRTKDAEAVLKERTGDLINLIDNKMVEENDIMNASDLEEMILDQKEYSFTETESGGLIGQKSVGGIQQAGTRLARFLELRTGQPATFFSNIDASHLRLFARLLFNGTDPSDVVKMVEDINKKRNLEGKYINTSEVRELVKETTGKEAWVDTKITYAHTGTVEVDDGWDEEERSVKDLMADMVFSQDTWEADETIAKPGERVRRMLLMHKDTMAILISDTVKGSSKTKQTVIDRVLNKLPFDMKIKDKNGKVRDFKTEFKNELNKYVSMIWLAMMFIPGVAEMVNDRSALASMIEQMLDPQTDEQKKELFDKLSGMEEEIDGLVDDYSKEIQAMVNKSLENTFEKDKEPKKEEPKEQAKVQAKEQTKTEIKEEIKKEKKEEKTKKQTKEQQAQQQKTPEQIKEEKEKEIKEGQKKLEEILTSSMRGSSGQGKFIKNVFSIYFEKASLMDKRCMFASAIKNEKANDQKILGGLLKGAGPLFQKMLQGLPADGMPEEIREALEDVKSKLAPIPDRIVKLQLLGMVERSNGRITRIEVTKALGAASVGQTFLCKMYGPSLPEEGKDVVVKLLKPDVRNRMMREKSVMLEAAKGTDETGGMEATYLGQLSRIEEELDLTIEARNVVKGKIYDKPDAYGKDDHVRAMKLDSLVDPTINSMMLEMAPGITVDRYIKELKTVFDERIEAVKRRADEIVPEAKKKPVPVSTPKEEDKEKNPEKYEKQKKAYDEYQVKLKEYNDWLKIADACDNTYIKRMQKLRVDTVSDLKRLIKRQKYMTALADKWVSEGIFGEGYYHGDLHAGNIMINDDGLTVIDFGNATSLKKEQQVEVTRMVAAAAVGDVEAFKSGLYGLIKPEFRELFENLSERLTLKLNEIFSLGDKNSAGQRIAVALLKAQELGLEVPSAIFNFSQCQLRLQNAIDEMNTQIEDMKKFLGEIDKGYRECMISDGDMYGNTIHEVSNGNIEEKTGDETVRRELGKLRYNLILMEEAGYECSEKEKKEIESGAFYKEKVKKFEAVKTSEISEKITEMLTGYFERISSSQEKIKMKELTVWESEIFNELSPIDGIMDVNGFGHVLLDRLEEAVKRKEKGEDIRKDAENWIKRFASDVTRKTDMINNCLTAFRDVRTAKKDKSKDKKKKLAEAVDRAADAYKQIAVTSAVYRQTLIIDDFKRKILSKDKRIEVDSLIRETAGCDEELGKELEKAYADFRDYEAANPDLFVAGSAQMEKLTELFMRITAKRIKPLTDDMRYIRREDPMNFVDVMGDTIGRNLSEALKRLGMKNALDYGKKLED